MEYLSFAHDDNYYAVPLHRVRYIAADKSLPETPVSRNGKKTVNTVQFDNQVCQLLGMEDLLGRAAKRDEITELVQLLNDREQDHLNWVNTLEDAIRNNKEFALTRDASACKFGRWYDTFQPEDPTLQHLMKKFDQPHRRIHGLADELLEMVAQGKTREALTELQYHHDTTLKRLRDLFSDARELVAGSVRPTVIMLQQGEDSMVGLKVENIGEVFSDDDPQRDTSSGSFLPPFASGWLKNVSLNDGMRPNIMVLEPTRLGDHQTEELQQATRSA